MSKEHVSTRLNLHLYGSEQTCMTRLDEWSVLAVGNPMESACMACGKGVRTAAKNALPFMGEDPFWLQLIAWSQFLLKGRLLPAAMGILVFLSQVNRHACPELKAFWWRQTLIVTLRPKKRKRAKEAPPWHQGKLLMAFSSSGNDCFVGLIMFNQSWMNVFHDASCLPL